MGHQINLISLYQNVDEKILHIFYDFLISLKLFLKDAADSYRCYIYQIFPIVFP